MKKAISLLLTAMFCVIIFSACGASGSQTASSTTAAVQPSQSETQQETTAQAKPVALNFLMPGTPKTDGKDFFSDIMPSLVKEKFPNIAVNTEQLPSDQFDTTLKARMAAGDGPDFYMYWPSAGLKALVDAGYAKDVSDYKELQLFNEGVIKGFTFDGKTYAVPQGVTVLGTYYNKDLFTKAGVSAVPQDWTSFLDACKKLKAANITPIVMGDKDAWFIQFGMYQIAANVIGGDFISYDNQLLAGQKHFTDPEWTKAVDMYSQLYKEGYIMKNTLGIGGAQATQLFIDGKAAMFFDGSWDYSAVTKKGAVDFERGFFALPANDTGKPTVYSFSGGAGIVVNPKTNGLDGVNSVIGYWLEKGSPLYQAWRENTPDLPAIKGETYDKKEMADYVQNFQNSPSAPFCNNNWPSGVSDVLDAKFQELIAGKGTPADVVKAMEDKLRELQAQKK